jgi:hypothetical protein
MGRTDGLRPFPPARAYVVCTYYHDIGEIRVMGISYRLGVARPFLMLKALFLTLP